MSSDLTSSSSSQQDTSSSSQSQSQTSSSGSSSTSSGGSQSSQAATLSIEETDYNDIDDVLDTPDPHHWATMMPLSDHFRTYACIEDENEPEKKHRFGREPCSEYTFFKGDFKEDELFNFNNFSRNQFQVWKEVDVQSACKFTTYVKDFSSNGTFINGDLVGKGVTRPLVNYSVISVASPERKAFMFVNLRLQHIEEKSLPDDFKAKYTLENVKLGDGASGTVRRGREKLTNKKVAVKIIKKLSISFADNLTYEAHLMKEISHNNIVKVEDFYEASDAVYIVLEYVEGGELFDFVKTHGAIAEKQCKTWFLQILEALEFLHSKDIVHRDLKPENILLSSRIPDNCMLKITDFGLSRFVSEHSMLKTLVGTSLYLAPEIITLKGYTRAVDLWSVGCILYIMLSGCPPFVLSDDLNLKICQGKYEMSQTVWDTVSDQAKDLVKSFLTVDVKKRITLDNALQHEWFSSLPPLKKRKIEEESTHQLKKRKLEE